MLTNFDAISARSQVSELDAFHLISRSLVEDLPPVRSGIQRPAARMPAPSGFQECNTPGSSTFRNPAGCALDARVRASGCQGCGFPAGFQTNDVPTCNRHFVAYRPLTHSVQLDSESEEKVIPADKKLGTRVHQRRCTARLTVETTIR